MTNTYITIELESEEIEYKDVNVTFYILRIYTTLYHTYQLLFVKDTFRWQVITAQ